MTDDRGRETRPRNRGRLFHYLDVVMDGRARADQRARIEDLHARLQLRLGETIHIIIAVYERYWALLEEELADVSRQVRRGMLAAFAAALTACAFVFVPSTLYLVHKLDMLPLTQLAASPPEACASSGQALCASVAAIAQDPARAFLATRLATMQADDAQSLAKSEAGLNAWLALGKLSEADRQNLARWMSQRMAGSP